jgi:hypothetical protein
VYMAEFSIFVSTEKPVYAISYYFFLKKKILTKKSYLSSRN